MHRRTPILGIVFVSLLWGGLGFAAEGATKEECVAKCREAADAIRQAGVDATVEKMNDPKGPFVWKDSYVFCLEAKTGVVRGHPTISKRMRGVSIREMVDVTGKRFVQELLDVAESEGRGWVTHTMGLKVRHTYVEKLPETNLVVGAGYFDGTSVEAPRFSASDAPVPRIRGKKVAVIVALKGFEDNEFRVPMELFGRAGIETVVVSSAEGTAKGAYGTEIAVVETLEKLNVSAFDAVVFVGGPGAPALHNDPNARRVAVEARDKGKVVSAICWAPLVLASAGVLDGKNATVNPFEADWFRKNRIRYTGEPVTVDGNLVTANGPAASDAFGRAVITALR